MTAIWLFDSYALEDKIILWVKTKHTVKRIEKNWTPSIFVGAENRSKLEYLSQHNQINQYVKSSELIERFESPPKKKL